MTTRNFAVTLDNDYWNRVTAHLAETRLTKRAFLESVIDERNPRSQKRGRKQK
jgi:hypothetical protein